MTDDIYQVKVADIFEGPMDLLVYLIKKNEVSIYDIPIALITDQYLTYIDWMKSMNVDVAGDFILMAATLTQIKSRMLLPLHGAEEDEDDPRNQIIRPLMEYLQIKSAADQLGDKELLGEDIFARPGIDKSEFGDNGEEIIQVGLFELIDAFRKILQNISPGHPVDLTTDRISVKDKMTQIIDILEEKGSVTFVELFSTSADKGEVIATFLALLEMAKLVLIRVVQHVQTGIIRIFYL